MYFISKPTNEAVLTVNPDQIAGLGSYRYWNLNICEANIGYLGGELQIEILNDGETEFEDLDIDIVNIIENSDSCSIAKKIEFGIVFTSDVDEAIIRCRVKSNLFPDDHHIVYSNDVTISLIPSKLT